MGFHEHEAHHGHPISKLCLVCRLHLPHNVLRCNTIQLWETTPQINVYRCVVYDSVFVWRRDVNDATNELVLQCLACVTSYLMILQTECIDHSAVWRAFVSHQGCLRAAIWLTRVYTSQWAGLLVCPSCVCMRVRESRTFARFFIQHRSNVPSPPPS